MRASIAVGFVVATAVWIGMAVGLDWDAAVRTGRFENQQRELIETIHSIPRVRFKPLVVFFGDSTLAKRAARRSYAEMLGRQLSTEADTVVLARVGLDPFHYWPLAAAVSQYRPEVVVMVANPRVLARPLPRWDDLLSVLPARELPRATMLPLHERGISLPHLLLLQLLSYPPVEATWYFEQGLRSRAIGRTFLRNVVPISDPVDLARPEQRRDTFLAYDKPLYARLPTVRMLEAAVEVAVRGGASVLVVGAPIPVRSLAEHGLYHPEVFAGRVAMLREVVEGAGGRYLDLHAALPASAFVDDFGHVGDIGSARISATLLPLLLDRLGDRS